MLKLLIHQHGDNATLEASVKADTMLAAIKELESEAVSGTVH